MAASPTQPCWKRKEKLLIFIPIPTYNTQQHLVQDCFEKPSDMVVFWQQKTRIEWWSRYWKMHFQYRDHPGSGQMRWVRKGQHSWGPLHSIVVKWELSFWISYFNINERSCELFIRQTVCRCFLPCTTRSRLSLALTLRSLFSKTENPALILTDRSCIQNSAWVNICTSLFFGQTCWAVEEGGVAWGGPSRILTGRETASAHSGPLVSSWL